MIALQIIAGVLGFLVTPVLLLLFFIQSRHILYTLGTALIFTGFGYLVTFSYGNAFFGVYLAVSLLVIQQLIYSRRTQAVRLGTKKRYIYGDVVGVTNSFNIKFIISLSPFYFIKNLPFGIRFRLGESKEKIDLREIMGLLLQLGKGISIHVDGKDAKVNIEVA